LSPRQRNSNTPESESKLASAATSRFVQQTNEVDLGIYFFHLKADHELTPEPLYKRTGTLQIQFFSDRTELTHPVAQAATMSPRRADRLLSDLPNIGNPRVGRVTTIRARADCPVEVLP
jgi:hypothetical protein